MTRSTAPDAPAVPALALARYLDGGVYQSAVIALTGTGTATTTVTRRDTEAVIGTITRVASDKWFAVDAEGRGVGSGHGYSQRQLAVSVLIDRAVLLEVDEAEAVAARDLRESGVTPQGEVPLDDADHVTAAEDAGDHLGAALLRRQQEGLQAPAEGSWGVEKVPGENLWRLTRDGLPGPLTYGSRVAAVDSMLERNARAELAEAEARLEEARARHDRSRRGEFVRTRLLTAMRALASDDGRLLADASIDLLTAARHLLSDREEADGPRTPTAFRLSVEDRDRLKLIGARFGNPDEASALRHVVRLVADLIEAGQGGRR